MPSWDMRFRFQVELLVSFLVLYGFGYCKDQSTGAGSCLQWDMRFRFQVELLVSFLVLYGFGYCKDQSTGLQECLDRVVCGEQQELNRNQCYNETLKDPLQDMFELGGTNYVTDELRICQSAPMFLQCAIHGHDLSAPDEHYTALCCKTENLKLHQPKYFMQFEVTNFADIDSGLYVQHACENCSMKLTVTSAFDFVCSFFTRDLIKSYPGDSYIRMVSKEGDLKIGHFNIPNVRHNKDDHCRIGLQMAYGSSQSVYIHSSQDWDTDVSHGRFQGQSLPSNFGDQLSNSDFRDMQGNKISRSSFNSDVRNIQTPRCWKWSFSVNLLIFILGVIIRHSIFLRGAIAIKIFLGKRVPTSIHKCLFELCNNSFLPVRLVYIALETAHAVTKSLEARIFQKLHIVNLMLFRPYFVKAQPIISGVCSAENSQAKLCLGCNVEIPQNEHKGNGHNQHGKELISTNKLDSDNLPKEVTDSNDLLQMERIHKNLTGTFIVEKLTPSGVAHDLVFTENKDALLRPQRYRSRCNFKGCKARFDRWYCLSDWQMKFKRHFCGECQSVFCSRHTRIAPHGKFGNCGIDSNCVCVTCFEGLPIETQRRLEKLNRLRVYHSLGRK